jgi:membrane fusion protein
MVSLFIVLLANGRYGKQETVKGLIRSESYYRLTSEKAGNVTDLYVKEGDSVNKGDPLFRVALLWHDVSDQGTSGNMHDETVKRLNHTLNELEAELTEHQNEQKMMVAQKNQFFAGLNNSLQLIDRILIDYGNKKEIYAAQLRDFKQLLKTKSINKSEIENTRQLILENELSIKKSQVEKSGLLQTQAEKEIYYSRIEHDSFVSENEIKRKKREVISELNKMKMLQEYIVTAPVKGIIDDVGIVKGDFIDGRTLTPSVIIKEDVPLNPEVILQLSSHQIGLLNKNQKVFLRVDTFPYENFGLLVGEVKNVSSTPTKVSLDDKESWFRVKLDILENDQYNKIPLDFLSDGMTVTTSLRQEKQTLLEWLFLPVKKALKRNPDYTHAEK